MEYERFFAGLAPRLDMARVLAREFDRNLAHRFNVLDYLRDDELGHCCPVKSRIESIGWGHRGIRLGSRMAGVPVKGAFFRIA